MSFESLNSSGSIKRRTGENSPPPHTPPLVDSKPFVLVTNYYPPIRGGTSTIVDNLLQAFDRDVYRLVTVEPDASYGDFEPIRDEARSVVRVGRAWLTGSKFPYIWRWNRWFRYSLISLIRKQIERAAREIDACAILAFYPSWPFLIAAYKAHLATAVPLVTYYMDAIEDAGRLRLPDAHFVEKYDLAIARDSHACLAISEGLADHLSKRYRRQVIPVPHTHAPPSRDAAGGPAGEIPASSSGGKRTILYTGVVEVLQEASLLRIARVIGKNPSLNARLVICTPNRIEHLLRRGFASPGVDLLTLPRSRVLPLQRSADLLLSVLPFENEIEAHALTAFPTKTIEYLHSEVPVLVHAPAGSFAARHARKYGYAFVSDSTDELSIVTGLEVALDNEAARGARVSDGLKTAREQFDLATNAMQIVRCCGLD